MAPIELSPESLFGGFPEPVLLLRDGLICYRNPAMERLFPGLPLQAPPPEELQALLSGLSAPTLALGRLAGGDYRLSLQETGAGLLLILRPAPDTSAPPRLDRLALRLRQDTSGLAASLQRLERDREDPDSARDRHYLAVANQSLYRLLRLADHLEFLDRSDDELYRPAPLDLAGFCRDLGEQVAGVWPRFRYEAEPVSLITLADAPLLRRLILSLLSNAMKSAGPEEDVGLKLAQVGGRALLTVWDHGTSAGDPARLFGDESRMPPSLDPTQGLGLGLPAARRIASLHGGTLVLEQPPEGGLRVTVSLPLRPPEEGVSLRSPSVDRLGGFSPLLVELSDALPVLCYVPEDLE